MTATRTAQALELAALGYHVHPLRPGKKAPASPHGHLDGTRNPATIAQAFDPEPRANIGVALAATGAFVIAPDCAERLAEFEVRGLPETMIVQSGSGPDHRHYWYRAPEGCPTYRLCRASDFDIMTNGYAVVPPSVTSGPYTFLTPLRPVEQLLEAPAWAVAMLAEAAAAEAAKPPPAPLPTQPLNLSDQAIVEKMLAARNGWQTQRLMAGDLEAHNGHDHSYSGAVLALLSRITFWTQDEAQVERIFASTALYSPEKWRGSFRSATLHKALQRSDYYDPSRSAPTLPNGNTPAPAPAVTRATDGDSAGEVCGAERARIAELEAQVAAERAARIAAEAERDAARADVEQLRQQARRFARIMANPKMAEGAKLMLMALVPEIESVRSGAGAPLDPNKPDPRVSGKAIHVNRAAMAERIGCKPDAAGDRIDKLVKAGLFKKRYRPKGNRDPETGKLLQGDGGKEILLEPVAEDLDILLAEATIAETPGRANQGGKRTPKRCPDHPDARLRRQRTDIYVCEDCGQITDEVTSETTIDPNRQTDVSGPDTPSPEDVAPTRLRYVKPPFRAPTVANRQIDASGYVPQEPAWLADAPLFATGDD